MASDLDDAIRAFPVASWLSSYTEVRDGGGNNLYADCPACKGRQKLQIRKETRRFRCFKCDDGGHATGDWRGWGTLFQLVRYLEGFSTVGQAVRFVIERSGLPDVEVKRLQAPARKLPPEAFPASECAPDHPAVVRLEERGLSHLLDHIQVAVDGKYANRWILPCRFMGKVEGFEAKAWHKSKQPKALYPTWFKPQDTIYTTAWDRDLDFGVVTESIFDAETFALNALGLYGSSLLAGQVDRLLELRRDFGVTRLFWALDPDATARQLKAIGEKTSALFKNFLVPLPARTVSGEKSDPNSLGHETCLELLAQAVEVTSELDLLSWEMRTL